MPRSAPDPGGLAGPAFRLERVEVAFGRRGTGARPALAIDDLELASGRATGVGGPSGAGKSTLLAALAGLVAPTSGRILAGDLDLAAAAPREIEGWRRRRVGLVFQDFHLVDEMSALENVLLPLRFDRFAVTAGERERAAGLLARLGLDAADRRVARLSRGERQRVAVARALIRAPAIVLADEPTASLDPAAATAVADLLIDHARAAGAALVIASHDAAVMARMDDVLRLADGRIAAGGKP